MPVTRPSTFPQRRGERDARHHKDRVRRQINEHIKNNIGKEDIITGGDGKIRVPVRGNKRYRFILDRGPQGQGSGDPREAGTEPGEEMYEVWLDQEEVEEILFNELELPRIKPKKETDPDSSDYKFDTYARKGPLIDKKVTLKQALLRSSMQGEDELSGILKDDLRYVSYTEKPRPKTKAVIFLAMDVSGSMGEWEKRIARLFFWWVTRFLRKQYDKVDIRFVAHTTEAKEVDEHQFFNRVESGGTVISSAYKYIYEIQQKQYPVEDWNIYILHASDGDNWHLDNEEVKRSIVTLTNVATLVGYLEIKHRQNSPFGGMWGGSTLSKHLAEYASDLGPEFVSAEVRGDEEIWPAIRKFFAKDQVEAKVV